MSIVGRAQDYTHFGASLQISTGKGSDPDLNKREMTEIRSSLGEVYNAPRRFSIKQFKEGGVYFIYYPDTTLIGCIKKSEAAWEQTFGPEMSREMVEALGAHIDADPKIGGW